jgi:hypothetical protein
MLLWYVRPTLPCALQCCALPYVCMHYGWNSTLRGRAKREGVGFFNKLASVRGVTTHRAPFQNGRGCEKSLSTAVHEPRLANHLHVQTIFQLELEERFVSGGRRCPRSLLLEDKTPIITFTPTLISESRKTSFAVTPFAENEFV